MATDKFGARTPEGQLPKLTSDEPPLTLDKLDRDALREIFGHLKVPLAFKLVCRAIRDAWPEATESYKIHALETVQQMEWAQEANMEITSKEIQLVAARGRLDLLYRIDACLDWGLWLPEVCGPAAEHGHVHVLKHFMCSGRMKSYDFPHILGWAAYGGQRPTMEWLMTRFPEVKLDCGLITSAARGGQLDVIKWLHREKGADWQKEAVRQAAKNGHVHVLEWLRYFARPPLMISVADDPWMNPGLGFEQAAQEGQLAVLKWAKQNMAWWGQHGEDGQHLDYYAGLGGHVHILQWLLTQDDDVHADGFVAAIEAAISQGHSNVLQWAHERGLIHDRRHAYYAHACWAEDEILDWFERTFPDIQASDGH